jgi:hypothetical protein
MPVSSLHKYIRVVYSFQNISKTLHFLYALRNEAVINSEGKVAYTKPTCIESERARTHSVKRSPTTDLGGPTGSG